MCRSKAEGGYRCRSHVTQDKTKSQQRVDYWLVEVERRRLDAETNPTASTRKRVKCAERALVNEQRKLQGWEQELIDLEARQLEAEKKRTIRHKRDGFLGADLKKEEWDLLADEARALGYGNRSELIRDRLNQMPTINPLTSGNSGSQELHGRGTGKGRIATEGRKADDQSEGFEREARGVRVVSDDLDRLEREAKLFGLTRSDYVRALVLDLDPRVLGHHLGDETHQRTRWATVGEEQKGGVKSDAQATKFWHQRVKQVRAEYHSEERTSSVVAEAEALLRLAGDNQ